jgi:microcompartment protein CcmK/EutM
MILGRVVGNVVSTHKDAGLDDIKLLLVEKVEPDGKKGSGDLVVAMDSVGAGSGDVVLLVAGSSARMTQATTGRPCDAAISAIIEQVQMDGRVLYNKSEDV